ncbi:succinate dehydrogenase, hydrophobic membrane anchor protein [Marinicella litoralis]|uniref:Succinate dehydrogenase hydrophobic membrane anchor subunit n=1 Tax=Marinicella litoralis TaxID=644220 RepID=A0A4R6XRF5_9GAMM|nr:succinate dehydrogenase, hydrophobic membrane anchor protein [Marinicella litoralis]TDR22475.1 succinate dehydrogenase subunit D [Marinicella litoralis]
MSYQSDVAKVKGLGSAKHGFSHWWMQRMTAVLLVPTGLFVLISLLRLDALSAQSMVVWMQNPIHSIVLLLFTLTASYHGALGLQVVVEDYVSSHTWQLILQYIIKLSMILLMMVNTYAVSSVLFG